MDIILYVLLGTIISVLSGFFGVGGGFILTPILLLTGFSPVEAITTSLLFTIGTSSSGIVAHIRMKNIAWKEGATLGLSGILATQVARPFVLFLEEKALDVYVIPAFYIILLSYFAWKMVRQGKGAAEFKSDYVFSSWKLVVIGLIGGFVSTTLGVGGGFIIVPLSIAFLGMNSRKAVGTSLLAVLLIVSSGFISYALTTTINYQVGLLLIIGGLIGSQFGAKLTTFYKDAEIAFLLGILYIATLTSVVLKVLHLNTVGLLILAFFIVFFLGRSLLRMKDFHDVKSAKDRI
ncbi:sulfite exporter TauE/SafE family protein [Cytobacillus spongiae]|uniref:sulfite exporter TauE/SafE family protein n=1 Tax=Cytobacillus spongiae TaxID=2901381 RepID=UPI001F287036|nr:sulfite exporter TauE/SafE family protein [Cytobacillus spongiae]UII56179.1 sulfite exporter TauE/SafE family protein [Cytobacillus spongiae]